MSNKGPLPPDFETGNPYFIGVQGEHVVMLLRPPARLTKTQALELAAMLVVLAGHSPETVAAAMDAMGNT